MTELIGKVGGTVHRRGLPPCTGSLSTVRSGGVL